MEAAEVPLASCPLRTQSLPILRRCLPHRTRKRFHLWLSRKKRRRNQTQKPKQKERTRRSQRSQVMLRPPSAQTDLKRDRRIAPRT
jgi:hypothetical protein